MEDQFINKKEGLEQDEIIKKHKEKRKKRKKKLACITLITGIIGAIFIIVYNYLNTNTYINCVENSNLNYKAFLKQNDFYDREFLEKGTNVVASLIKNIEANFEYDMNFDQDIEYIYNYDITAKLEVLEGEEEDTLLEKEESLVKVDNIIEKNKSLHINEKVDIDYGAYNDKLNSFITTYSLNDTLNRLVLTMHLHVINPYDGSQINKNTDVLTIKIPLTTQTVNIGIITNVINNNGSVLVNTKEVKHSAIILYSGLVLMGIAIITLIRFIKYSLDVRSAETMYDQIFKKILISYKSYIQEINNDLNENEYEKIGMTSFNNLIEMRDVINAPILMYKESKYRTKFWIIDDKRLFVYILDSKLIRENLREKSRQKNKKI